MSDNPEVLYGRSTLASGIRSRRIDAVNGLSMHILEAGYAEPGRPLILLLHGFPELGYSWRHQLLPLAEAGYHAVAPDQRGYGLTTGWDARYASDLSPFRLLNLVADAVALVSALGHRRIHAIVGHDFGSPVAAWCALVRPDVFRRVVLMSAPFGGTQNMPKTDQASTRPVSLQTSLARLDPPRKHYQWYYSTAAANSDMLNCSQGLIRFLREYYHVKSADWPANAPAPLKDWTATELGRLPEYYVMAMSLSMPQTTAGLTRSMPDIENCSWLTNEELKVYADVFAETGFQGGLNWYRCATDRVWSRELDLFAGCGIEVPACFIGGKQDWGVFQSPGVFERMTKTACTDMREVHLLGGAGHWVQQEQPTAVSRILHNFFRSAH